MAEKSTFFNSVTGDRKYKAEDMAAHFAKLITNGVFPSGTQLQVTEDAGMNVIVSAGSAWVNGYAYHNDGDYTLTFDAADGVLNRIDRIVVRWGRLARSINLAIVKGTPGSSPSAPAIVRSVDYYDLGIATVSISAGITAITQAMITDTRLDSNVCGFVSSLIQPDTSGWFAQFESAFNAWFATLEDVLDENAAANLLNLINDLAGAGRTIETVKGVSDTLASHLADYAYQTPTVVGTQIRLTKQSDTARLHFKLAADLSGGTITISLDSGATSKPLKNIDGENVIELEKGFVEVVENAVNFTLRPRGGALKIDALLADYVIYAGENISAGDLVEFVNGQAKKATSAFLHSNTIPAFFGGLNVLHFSAITLTDTSVLLVYGDKDNSDYGTAIILTISGTTITKGTPFVFESASTSLLSAIALDGTKILITYAINTASKAVVLTVSGATITKGTTVNIVTSYSACISSTLLSAGKVLVAYMGASSTWYGMAVILSISGTTITVRTPVTFKSDRVQEISVTTLDSTRALVGYSDYNDSHNGKAVVLSISGTTITVNTHLTFNSANTLAIKMLALSSTSAVVVYSNFGNGGFATTVVLSISATTITVGTPVVAEAANSLYFSLVSLGDNRILVVFKGRNNYGVSVILTISSTIITVGEVVIFNKSATTGTTATLFDTGKVLVAYQNGGNNNNGEINILLERKHIQGLAAQNGVGGETKKFYDWRS